MNWDDQPNEESGPRGCERCGAGASAIDSLQAAQHAMCREMLLGPNRPAWLCFDCRKQWLKFISTNEDVEQLIWAEQQFDIWRSRACHPAGGPLNETGGMQLLTQLRAAKAQLDKLADDFCGGC